MLQFYQNSSEKLLTELLNTRNQVIYAGFDATSDSLHIGNLALIMTLKKLQEKCNHLIIILIGGATTRIGDPTDKTSARKVLSEETVSFNTAGIKKSLKKFLKFASTDEIKIDQTDKCTNLDELYGKAILVDNYDWWKNINYIQFITQYGKLFSVNNMVKIETIKRRLENEQHLSLLEFNYMVMQAYDFLHLNYKFKCTTQLGGSDQWGNIIQGVNLIKKIHNQETLALTIPLITNAAGEKMGKTGNNPIWLNENKLSPYEYYQYWLNMNDNDIQKFQNIYTMLEKDVQLLSRQELAFEITQLCHGNEETIKAVKTTQDVFNTKQNIAENAPPMQINHDSDTIHIYDLLVKSKIVQSKSQAKKLIDNAGIKINRKTVSHDSIIDTYKKILLSKGKKNHYLCEFILNI
ncbi:MAG: tyrosine--tRNA ligase [Pseudomonadota bacterium]